MQQTLSNQEAATMIQKMNNVLVPFGYTVNDAVELCEVKEETDLKTGKKKIKHIPLALFVPFPTSQTIVIETAKSSVVYRVSALTFNSATQSFIQLDTLTVQAGELEDMKWPAQWGIDAVILPGYGFREKVRYCTQLLGQSADRDEVVTEIGWYNGNFIHAGGSIGPDELNVEPSQSVARYILPIEVKNPKRAIQASLAALDVASHHITYPLLALVFLAPLMRFYDEAAHITAKFVLWFCGNSGLQKSTIVSLFLCHFGKFSDAICPASFDATANGLERILFDAKDVVVLVDDYYPSAAGSEGERMIKVAQKLLRAVGDRRGKPRMRPDLKQSPSFPPRGQVVVTAEDLPPSGNSNFARFICVNIDAADRDKQKLAEAMKNTLPLARSMFAYIEFLIANDRKIKSRNLLQEFQDLRTEYANCNNHDRIAESLAWLDVGFSSFLTFAEAHLAISQEQACEMRAEATTLFKKIGSMQQTLIRGSNPVDQFVDNVRTLLQTKAVKMFERNPVEIGNPYAVELQSLKTIGREWAANERNVGFFDDANYYFFPDAIYSAHVRLSKDLGVNTVPTKHILLKRLAAAGKIIPENPDSASPHNCPKVTIRGSAQRYLVVPRRIIFGDENEAPASVKELEDHEAALVKIELEEREKHSRSKQPKRLKNGNSAIYAV